MKSNVNINTSITVPEKEQDEVCTYLIPAPDMLPDMHRHETFCVLQNILQKKMLCLYVTLILFGLELSTISVLASKIQYHSSFTDLYMRTSRIRIQQANRMTSYTLYAA